MLQHFNMSRFKVLFFSTIIFIPLAILAVAWGVILNASTPASARTSCAFCREEVIASQTFFEGDHVLVMLNYMPILEGHSMIVPKRHVARIEDLSAEELFEMHQMIQKLSHAFEKVYGSKDLLLCCQNGDNAGQTVPHMHMHVIPRPEANVLTKLKLWYAMLVRPLILASPLTAEEMQAISTPLAQEMF